MKITNKLNLPEALVRAVQRHEHRGADYSATQLLKSPRQLWLERRHSNELESDVSELIWSLFGTAVHNVIESGEGDHEFSETYLTQEVGGVTVSGTADLYDTKEKKISDWKTTSVWSVIYDSRKDEWTKQLNVYAWLMRRAGFGVNKLEIVAILKDWSRTKAKHDASYPQSQVEVIPIQLLHDEDIEFWIKDQVARLEWFKDVEDDLLPPCTDEYRWKDPERYALMKKGNKRAKKIYDSYQDAASEAANSGADYYIEVRTSEARRCADYCPVAQFCNQYQEEVNG